MLKTQRSMVLM